MPTASPKTFAIVSHAWNDDMTGGAFKVATDFARYLADRGEKVHYLCGSEAGADSPETVDGVTVWRYRYPVASGPRALAGHVRAMGRLFRRVAEDHSLDAVSGHSPLQHYAVARNRDVCRAARFVYTVHSPFLDELQAGGRGALPVRMMARWIDGRCLKLSDHVTTDSRYTLGRMNEIYHQRYAAKMSVQSPWIDVDRFRPVDDRDAARDRLGAPWTKGIPTFVSVRRLEKRMGLDQLIRAVKVITEEGRPMRLLIGGSGSMEAELRALIESLKLTDVVHLLGRVPDADLVETYAAADCFVLPTTALECFGLITLESYACGVPVIATPVAAIPEIVRQHDAEWLTEGTSATDIAVTLRRFLDHKLSYDASTLRAIAESYSVASRAAPLADVVLGSEKESNSPEAVALGTT